MITTVTANPSLDRTLHLPRLEAGRVNRATRTLVEPSGKGVNVALGLHGCGVAARAVLPVGGASGAELVTLLDGLGLAHVDVPVAGAVRSNVSLVEADGRTTKVNEPGPTLAPDEVAALLDAAQASSARGEWVVWAGSLPGGFSPQRLADAVGGARAAGRQVALDCSGPALVSALSREGEQLPHLVKPNAEELAELAGRALPTLGDVVDVAGDLVRRGVRTVLVSLGGDGAVLVDARMAEPLHGRAQAGHVVNTVGAGDAFLSGWLAAAASDGDRGAGGLDDALASALRSGATAVEHQGTLLGRPDPRRPVSMGPVRRDLPVAAH